jgi:integrase
VLDWAKARGFRSGENPARWRGHLDQLLPKRSSVRRVQHHPALPYSQIAAFMSALRKRESSTSALALEFSILTAARTGETIGATAGEFDLAGRLWVVPGERMKAGRPHTVPLSQRASEIVRDALSVHGARVKPSAPLFVGNRPDGHLSNGAMLMLLDGMGRGDLTTHGFRSTFRDWAAECTNFPNEVVEMALAHVVRDKTESAYRRGDLLKKRAALMEAWAGYCATVSRSVVPLSKVASL